MMGPFSSTTIALRLALASLVMAMPAAAQQDDSQQDDRAAPSDNRARPPIFSLPPSPPPIREPERQGPELDVFRAPATTQPPTTPPATPPVIVPSVQPPPPATARPTPPAPPERRQGNDAARSLPARPAPAPDASDQPGQPARPASLPTQTQTPAQPPASPPAQAEPQGDTPSTPMPPPPPETRSGLLWLLIAAGVAILLALAGLLLARRRRPVEDGAPAEPEQDRTPTPSPSPPPAPPPGDAPPRRAPRRASPPSARPIDPDPDGGDEPAAGRPWLDIALTVESARYSLMGLTIGYALTLSNHGGAEAMDIMVHGFLGPADGDQQAALHRFFGGSAGAPLHSVVGIAPGASYRLTGELRLPPEAITPIRQGDRSLFVPLLAIDAHYRWDGQGSGRTGRAFVIGQERQPPAERLAPFRIDLGPRQYRDAAGRATALLLQR